MIQKKLKYYDGFCQMRELVRDYNKITNQDDYFGASISPLLGELLWEFDLDEDIYAGTTPNGEKFEEKFNQEYEDSNIDEVFRELYKKSSFKTLLKELK
jgi:hypothetical protein